MSADTSTIDFDALWAEQEAAAGPPPQLRAFGEVIDLPRSVPMALHRLKAATYGEGLVATIAVLVGNDRVERWAADGATVDQFEHLAKMIGSVYRHDSEPDAEASE